MASRTLERGASEADGSSSTMTISEPSPSCNSTAFSGVMKWVEPSMCERKVTPSSVTLERADRLNTW